MVRSAAVQVAGKYTLVRKIAVGGMAEVFLARQRGIDGFDKQVVLKRILPHLSAEKEFVTMFLDEARTAADLRHPNIVDVYEVGEDQGTWFIAMEYLRGEDLRRILREASLSGQPMPLGPALEIVIEAARGLDHAHKKKDRAGKPLNLVHRDVSPANIVVTRDGVTKVVDFGIARARGRSTETEPGIVKGKFQYMSPEQATGSELDARSDLFSLGIVLYEVTTLRKPFEQNNLRAVADAMFQSKWDRPGKIVPGYPVELTRILERCLATEIENRFPNCGALSEALEEFLDAKGIPHSQGKVTRYLRELFGDPEEEVFEIESSMPGASQSGLAGDAAHVSALKGVLHSGNERRRTNLPDLPRFFVGRERDIANVSNLLLAGARLLTLRGPGGAGKTRLAIHAASAQMETFAAGGVWFCDLTEARTLEQICRSVGDALGVPLTGATALDSSDQLGRAIGARGKTLLVLDNFEQVVAHGPDTVARWLAAAPECSILATSRERLKLKDEQVHDVQPLAVPAGDTGAFESPAVQLFVHRVKQSRADFELKETDAPIVASIVRELDGIPLAIELAAARMGVLSPAKLLERLAHRLDLLKSTDRDTTTRQSTLRSMIDWSWSLLEPWERDALAQTAVFRGGFSLEAAEAVLDLSGHAQAPWVLDVLQSLADKSLLRVWEPADFPGEMRFGLYVNVREYAASRLDESGKAASTRARHANWLLDVARGWAEAVDTHGGLERRRRIAMELENLEAVLERALSVQPPTPASALEALHAVEVMSPVLSVRGPFALFLSHLDRALGAADLTEVPPGDTARVLTIRGRVRRLRGMLAEAIGDLSSALRLARAAGDRGLVANVLMQLGMAEGNRGNVPESHAHLKEAIDIAHTLGDKMSEAVALGYLASLSHGAGIQETAIERYRQALSILQRLGNRRFVGINLGNYGYLLRQRGQLDDARAAYERALSIYREVGDRPSEGNTTGSVAGLLMELGKFDEAREMFGRALAIHREVGNRRSEAIFSTNAGICEHLAGRPGKAADLLEQSVLMLTELKDRQSEGLAWAFLGAARADLDRIPLAGEAFARARDLLDREHDLLQTTALEILTGLLDLATLRKARADGTEARDSIDAARKKLTAGGDPIDPSSPVRQNEDVRLALKLLEAAWRRLF